MTKPNQKKRYFTLRPLRQAQGLSQAPFGFAQGLRQGLSQAQARTPNFLVDLPLMSFFEPGVSVGLERLKTIGLKTPNFRRILV
jgi:hypothetical protein